MSEDPTDWPLSSEDHGSRPHIAEVIDLAGVRVAWGRSTAPITAKCEHHSLIYSQEESRVWCEGCGRTIENFDAFMALVGSFREMCRAARAKMERAEEALKAVIVRRASKVIDRMWNGGKMAPCCPRCGLGLLPEDFENGVASSVSQELERARRKKKAGKP